jgi:apolipoprotein N-acyltransferase
VTEPPGPDAALAVVPRSMGARAIPFLVVAASGALHFLGFAGFGIWPLCFVAFVPLLLVLEHETRSGASAKRVFALGAVHGFVAYTGGYYWLEPMLETFSGYGPAASVAFASVFWVYHGLQVALLAVAYRWLRTRGVPTLLATLPPFMLIEWAFPQLFPSYLANSLHTLPIFLQVVDLGGPLLLSAVPALVNVALFELVRARFIERRWALRPVAAAAAMVALTLGYGVYRIDAVETAMAAAPKLDVGLVQVDMGIFEKWGDPEEGLRRHIEQSLALEREAQPDLIIWPESSFAFALPDRVRNVRRSVMGPVRTPLLFGGLSRRYVDGRRQHYNTAFMADADGRVLGTYDKTYLLAFGEYLPFGDDFPELYELSPNSSHFTPGERLDALPLGDYRIAALVCYEDVLPEFTRSLVAASDPHLLVNMTNDAWFGDTQEPWIHLALAKFRAVEHHRYLVRATNTGVSAIIDPVGRVVTHSGVEQRASLSGEVAMMNGATLYSLAGPWPGYLALVICGFLIVRYRRRARPGTPNR